MAALLGARSAGRPGGRGRGRSEGEVCAGANDNAPGQVVVSGTKAAVERAIALAGEKGAKRSILLPVSAPFHCALMAAGGARDGGGAGAAIALAPPTVPLVANVTAAPVSDPETIRRLLVEQVTGMVRWRESVLRLKADGVGRAGRARRRQGAGRPGQAHRPRRRGAGRRASPPTSKPPLEGALALAQESDGCSI